MPQEKTYQEHLLSHDLLHLVFGLFSHRHVEGSNGRKQGGGDIRALDLSREAISNHNSKHPKEEHQDEALALASILIPNIIAIWFLWVISNHLLMDSSSACFIIN